MGTFVNRLHKDELGQFTFVVTWQGFGLVKDSEVTRPEKKLLRMSPGTDDPVKDDPVKYNTLIADPLKDDPSYI